jgi:glucan phosphoethanolaminetransferase (alkaline phosphatase superfamily)
MLHQPTVNEVSVMLARSSCVAGIASKLAQSPPPRVNQKGLTSALCFLIAAIVVASVHMQLNARWLLNRLAREDGIFESIGAINYFAASFLLLYVIVAHRLRNIWVLGVALLFFLAGGEEISWGQRIFAVSTPDSIRAINVQGETNLHNIEGLTGWIRALSLVVLWGIFVAIPVCAIFRPTNGIIRSLALPVAGWSSALAIVAGTAFMAIPRAYGGPTFALDEVGELLVSIAAVGFALGLWAGGRREGRGALS